LRWRHHLGWSRFTYRDWRKIIGRWIDWETYSLHWIRQALDWIGKPVDWIRHPVDWVDHWFEWLDEWLQSFQWIHWFNQ